VKNKMAAPFRETEFDVGYGQGISRAGELIDLGVEAGLLEKSGAWIAHGGERLGNGREAAKAYLLEHQDLLRQLRTKLLERNGIGGSKAAGDEKADRGEKTDKADARPTAAKKAA
jgi:recombination protein RecA